MFRAEPLCAARVIITMTFYVVKSKTIYSIYSVGLASKGAVWDLIKGHLGTFQAPLSASQFLYLIKIIIIQNKKNTSIKMLKIMDKGFIFYIKTKRHIYNKIIHFLLLQYINIFLIQYFVYLTILRSLIFLRTNMHLFYEFEANTVTEW